MPKYNKLIILLSVILLSLSIKALNLFTPYLWYDEAGQVYISKGLNHWSGVNETEGGVLDVIENNKYHNLDPGGFGIILHFWSKISSGYIWLRILPLIFFIGTIVCLCWLLYLKIKNLNISIFLGSILFIFPSLLILSGELRAYSMECMGTVLCLIGVELIKMKATKKNLFLLGCVFSFFITSRYASSLIVFITSLYILYLVLKSTNSIKSKFLLLVSYALPLAISLFIIVKFALMEQNPDVKALTYLPYLSKDLSLLYKPVNLVYILFNIMLGLSLFFRKRFSLISKYVSFFILAIGANMLFILLSLWGKHPWDPLNTRCISIFLLTAISGLVLIGEVMKRYFRDGYISYLYIFIFIVAFAGFSLKKEKLRKDLRSHNSYYDIYNHDISEYDKIYVCWRETPSIKYLFQFGELKDQKEVLNNTTFSDSINSNNPDAVNNYDLIIMSSYDEFDKSNWQLIEGTRGLFKKIENE